MTKIERIDDVLYINDDEIILSRWVCDSHFDKVLLRDAFGYPIFEGKVPIETQEGIRADAADVVADLGANFKESGFSNWYQWVFLGKSGEIVKASDDAYEFQNYGNGGALPVKVKSQVATFDGVGSYVATGINLSGKQKATLILKGERLLGDTNVISQTDNNTFRLSLLVYNDVLYMSVSHTSSNVFYCYIPFAITKNTEIAMVFDGTLTGNNALKMYIDGILQAPTYLGTPPNSIATISNKLTIGKHLTTYSDAKNNFAGVWDDALTLAQINDLPASIKLSSCLFATNFKEGNGSEIFNLAYDGSLPNGTITGATLSAFWANKSQYAENTLWENGYEVYENDSHVGDSDYYIYVEFVNGSAQNPTISGYSLKQTVQPYKLAVSSSEYQQSDNAPLNTIYNNYAALNFMKNPAWWSFKDLNDADLSGVDEKDFKITKKDGVIKDMVTEPYDKNNNLKY